MKTKVYNNYNKSKRTWYDFSQRLWCMQYIDKFGNQVGEADWTAEKYLAMQWLKGDVVSQ